jgi:hypothetical protein
MKKTENPNSGVVHWMTRKKWRGTFFICLCGMVSGLVWTKAGKEKVTCLKCLSIKKES